MKEYIIVDDNEINENKIKENEKTLIEEDKISQKFDIKYNIIKKKIVFIFITLFILFISYKKNGDIFYDSREEAFQKALDFLKSNMEGKLLQQIPTQAFENPIASAVIPVYNSKQYISRAIKSIQNQDMINIEIILVNDFSTDDTLSFIEEIQKEDPRIKIINNKKNMGIIYSRCIGVLSSKSRYIFPLDNDDMFLDSDVFKNITDIAEEGYYDIVEFKGIFSKRGHDDILNNKRIDTYHSDHPLNIVVYQPELGDFALLPKDGDDYDLGTCYLWAKCFRTEIYKEAINKLGTERYSRHMIRHEDILMNYALFNTARSYKFVGKYGIFYIFRQSSASRKSDEYNLDIYHIYILDIALDFVKDEIKNKRIIPNLAMNVLGREHLKEIIKNSDYLKNLFYSSMRKVLQMDKIPDYKKNEIRNKAKQLKLIEHDF